MDSFHSCCARNFTPDGVPQAAFIQGNMSECWTKTIPIIDGLQLTSELERKAACPRLAEETTLDEGISLGFDGERPNFDITAGATQLGSGGFGSVYQAYLIDKPVAVKTCHHPQDLHASANSANTPLWREARVCSRLRHPNIVEFIGMADTVSGVSLVMEYCSGGPLSALLSKQGELLPSTLLTWAQQIAEGMCYLHHSVRGGPVVHKDLKSANVLLSRQVNLDDPTTLVNNPVKIGDFGLAGAPSNVDCASHATSCMGTFPWLAPESIRRSLFTCASDTWSFGVVLWELLTSEVPYHGINKWAVAYGISTQQLQLPIPATCPAKLRSLIEDCWRYNPNERPAFPVIRDRLLAIQPDFVPLEQEPFTRAQLDWRREISKLFDELRQKEQVLRSREEEIRLGEAQQAALRSDIRKREQALRRRENILLGREIELGMMEKEQTEQQADQSRPASAAGRRSAFIQFFRRLSARTPLLQLDNRSTSSSDNMALPLIDSLSSNDDDAMSFDDGFESSSSAPQTPTSIGVGSDIFSDFEYFSRFESGLPV
ncbi:mitogen-activated protein kinase kinase kinase 21-like [Sycon ciliatum]|uniref:mitogen-activated protein kinase kinase kinase 21-like n=1 Tax=Sycon ciliatum TaxID=27933 RepID=UPI0031F65070